MNTLLSSTDLETAIDSQIDVLELLAAICREKAEHVRTSWQDKELADAWEKAAGKLDKIIFPI